MRVAVWNLPPVDFLTAGFSSGVHADRFDVQRLRLPDCERVLLEDHVDAALLPTLSVLKHHEQLDVVPAVALSTWSHPFVRLVLDSDLGTTPETVAYNPDYEQEAFVARVILREHYKMEPDFTALPNAANEELLAAAHDATLIVGPDVPTMSFESRVLDLGQEWYELANYPMTWGLFAARRGALDEAAIRAIRDGVLASEQQRKVWLRAQETSEVLHAFYADELRFRLDDLCVAGLTEFRQYLFYYDVVDDVREIPFVFLSDDEAESDDGSKPLL